MQDKKNPLEIIGFIGPIDKNINLLTTEIETVFTHYIFRKSGGRLFKCVIGSKNGIEVIRATFPVKISTL